MERLYATSELILDKLQEYMSKCGKEGKVPTKPGFRVYSGITNRTWNNYLQDMGDDYRIAMETCDDILVDNLMQMGNKDPKNVYYMYAMKAMHGYSDRPQQQINVGVQNNLADFSTQKLKDIQRFIDQWQKNRQLEDNIKVNVTPKD